MSLIDIMIIVATILGVMFPITLTSLDKGTQPFVVCDG